MNSRETIERGSKTKAQQLLEGQKIDNTPASTLGRGILRHKDGKYPSVGSEDSVPQPTVNPAAAAHGRGLLRYKGEKSSAVGSGSRKAVSQLTNSDVEETMPSPRPLRERLANKNDGQGTQPSIAHNFMTFRATKQFAMVPPSYAVSERQTQTRRAVAKVALRKIQNIAPLESGDVSNSYVVHNYCVLLCVYYHNLFFYSRRVKKVIKMITVMMII